MNKKLDQEKKSILIELMHWFNFGEKLISLKNNLTKNIRYI